jgi:UDP-glucose 4-epimerase|tara:strand:- start:439 stop:603 length:165 start_codon:yes stop_codon:yes gene_type:complete
MARRLVIATSEFIESNIVRRLFKDNETVIGLDNLSNGRMENINVILEDLVLNKE